MHVTLETRPVVVVGEKRRFGVVPVSHANAVAGGA